MDKSEFLNRRFKRWCDVKEKKIINLTLQEQLELLAFGVAPFDITQ